MVDFFPDAGKSDAAGSSSVGGPSHIHSMHAHTCRVPGVKSHHFGPGMKLTGGQLIYCQEDRIEGRVRVPRSLDPEEILHTYRREQAEATAASSTAKAASGLTPSAVQATPRNREQPAPRRAMTSSNSQHTGVCNVLSPGGRSMPKSSFSAEYVVLSSTCCWHELPARGFAWWVWLG